MRKTILCWFLGLISLGTIAGCGAFRNCPEPCRSCGCATGVGPGESSTCRIVQPDSPSANAQSKAGRIGFAWFEIDVEKPAPVLPQAAVSAQHLREIAPPSARVQISATEPFEIVQPGPATLTVAVQTVAVAVPEKEKTVAMQSVTGQVHQYRNTWRLRYAAIDQEDPYGGVVVLDGGAELSQLREGQNVRVSGILVPPESRTGSAHYRVQAIEIVN
jgi:hypothetical protein